MGLFDSIRGAMGQGQPTVRVHLETLELPRGGLVKGTAEVVGTERAVPLTAFDIQVVQVTQNVGKNAVAKGRVSMGGVQVQPGQSVTAPFELQLPLGSAPTGGLTSYEVVVSADVPGMDPKGSAPLTVTDEVDPMSREDTTRYHVLPEQRSFRHSSVRGDFRLSLMPDGFLGIWKTRLTCRNADGGLRWTLDGWGRTASASPDGSRVATSDRNKRLCFVDAATGEPGQPIDMPSWVDDIAFLEDGTIVAAGSDALFVLDAHGQLQNTLEDLGYGARFFSSMIAGPGRVVFVSDANANKVVAVDLDRGVVGSAEIRSPGALHPNHDRSLIAVDTSSAVHVLDGQLQPKAQWKIPGKEGVRYVGQEPHSYTHWKSHPRIAPGRTNTLINDGTGLLWLVDTPSGRPHRSFDRAVVDYVEDTMWWDDQHFVAITNDGKVRGLRVDGTVVFEDQDA
ncbi:MAG: sporulation protein [Sandaracinaceae bacterium]